MRGNVQVLDGLMIVTFNHFDDLTFVRQKVSYIALCRALYYRSIVGSVVECSPATRAARVRFPDDAVLFFFCRSKFQGLN